MPPFCYDEIIEFPHFALRQPGRVFDSIKDRVKTPVLRYRILVSYVPLRFYPSGSASCWNKYTPGLPQCKMRKLQGEILLHSYTNKCYTIR